MLRRSFVDGEASLILLYSILSTAYEYINTNIAGIETNVNRICMFIDDVKCFGLVNRYLYVPT